jgi:hypothetical protein
MLTLNNIINEIKDVPLNRLEEVFQLIQSFTPKNKINESKIKEILSFGGSLSELSEADYLDYLNHIKENRSKLFDRKVI